MQKNTKDSSKKNTVSKNKKISEKNAKEPTSVVKTNTSKTVSKKATTKKNTTNSAAKKNTTSVPKKTATKSSTPKKTSTKKAGAKSTTKKATVKATNTKKTNSKTAKKSTAKTKKAEFIEYYDLPYRYNQTIVKILAQTPTTLFVYWDISDEDREKYKIEFGEDFFNNTVPVLIVHNKTMNYSFEIEVNDFANSWYFNVNDAKSDYEIELGRRAKQQTSVNLPNNYMHVTSSNVIEAPNNHILFEKNQKVIFFRNTKTNETISKDVTNFNFMKYAGKIYNIYDVYKEIYKNKELQNLERLSSSN